MLLRLLKYLLRLRTRFLRRFAVVFHHSAGIILEKNMRRVSQHNNAPPATMVVGTNQLWSKSRLVAYVLSLGVVLYLSFTYLKTYYPNHVGLSSVGDSAAPDSKIANSKEPSAINGFYSATSYVQEIHSLKQLQDVQTTNSYVMVVFYASWCAHCRWVDWLDRTLILLE